MEGALTDTMLSVPTFMHDTKTLKSRAIHQRFLDSFRELRRQ
jgi:hypothetical protein